MSTDQSSGEQRADSPIEVKRTDGWTSNILKLFSAKNSSVKNSSVKKKDESEDRSMWSRKSAKDEIGQSKHEFISAPRSDGANRDLISVKRSVTDSAAMASTLRGMSLLGSSRALDPSSSSSSSSGGGGGSSKSDRPSSTGRWKRPELDVGISVPFQARMSSFQSPQVRIVHMSDTHNFLAKSGSTKFLPHGDILVHSGDFSNNGTEEEFQQFNLWLESVSHIYHYRVVVLGKCDTKKFKAKWGKMSSMLPNATHVLCHSEATILGIRFYGSPWNYAHKRDYSVRDTVSGTSSTRFDEVPKGIDVLITHGPSYGKLDLMNNTNNCGSRELAQVLKEVQPLLHLHGCVKESRGIYFAMGRETMAVNSCLVDHHKTALFAVPHVILGQQISVEEAGLHSWTFNIASLE